MEAVEVGSADATHLSRVLGLQRRQQRLADVEVSVLQFALTDKMQDDIKMLLMEFSTLNMSLSSCCSSAVLP